MILPFLFVCLFVCLLFAKTVVVFANLLLKPAIIERELYISVQCSECILSEFNLLMVLPLKVMCIFDIKWTGTQ